MAGRRIRTVIFDDHSYKVEENGARCPSKGCSGVFVRMAANYRRALVAARKRAQEAERCAQESAEIMYRQRDRLEAEVAAMREALEFIECNGSCCDSTAWAREALATDAGRDLLERLRRAEEDLEGEREIRMTQNRAFSEEVEARLADRAAMEKARDALRALKHVAYAPWRGLADSGRDPQAALASLEERLGR